MSTRTKHPRLSGIDMTNELLYDGTPGLQSHRLKQGAELLKAAGFVDALRAGTVSPWVPPDGLGGQQCSECGAMASWAAPGLRGPICTVCKSAAEALLEAIDAAGFGEDEANVVDFRSAPVLGILAGRPEADVVARRPEAMESLRDGRWSPVPASSPRLMCTYCGGRPAEWSVPGAQYVMCTSCRDGAVEVVELLDDHQAGLRVAALRRRRESARRHRKAVAEAAIPKAANPKDASSKPDSPKDAA